LMYRKRPWTMRQYSGFATAKETNKRFKSLLSQGQTGLNVAFDLPTQLGLDTDDPMADGEVGRVGMAVDTLKDMEDAFEGIPLDKISASLTINATAPVLLAMYIAMAEMKGLPIKELRGTLQNDILKEFIGRGAWVFPVETSIRLVCDVIEYCARNAPKYYPVSICGYHIRESGANPVQEVAYAYLIAKAYIDHTLERGLEVDEFVPRLSFNFDIFGNFFEQVAKFRAARRLWARIVKEEYGAQNEQSMKMKMIAGGGGGGLTIEQPENNIVRGAYYALISALSGTQTMALCSYDEAYTIPSEKAAVISLRTMQILMEEMGLCDVADPLGGSYYIEWLTNELESRIIETMKKVEDMGGIVKCVSNGYVQSEVARQAYELEKKIQDGEVAKVGVNRYRTDEEEREIEFHRYSSEDAQSQVQRLNEVKRNRDDAKVKEKLERLKDATGTNENLMPYIVEAIKEYATIGEITKVLKEAFGVFKEPVKL
ncbi:MAG: methylmalonyl-CoA mutase, partial [Thermoplasmata archaeon]|nr:methylmalonyl-CoA mutase [Thermoplasmata archaeon]